MKDRAVAIATITLVSVFFILAVAFYPRMPDMMASHWNAQGEADGTMSRFWGLFLLPLVSLGMAVLLFLLPRIDPLKANIQKFKGYYYGFIIAFLVYFMYIYILTIAWNLGWEFDFSQMLMPAMGILMFLIGILVSKARRNFFIGIRTPWTLSSEEVWNRTHQLGGRLFKIVGIIILLLSFVPEIAIYALLGLVLGTTIWLVVYSYVLYRRLGVHPQSPIENSND
jgi:uncharacterized membrane protein